MSLKPRPKRARRSCTDCLCFLIFLIFIAGMAVITALTALDNGFNRLRYGFDSLGNICNMANSGLKSNANATTALSALVGANTTGLPFVLFFNYTSPVVSAKACVRSCPAVTIYNVSQYVAYTSRNNVSFCFYSVSPGNYDPKLCPPFPIYSAVGFANRCVPDLHELISTELSDDVANLDKMINITSIINPDVLRLSVVTLFQQLPKIGLLSLAALAITVVLVFLLRYIAKLMILLVLLLVSVGCIALSTFLWLKYVEVKRLNLGAVVTIPLIGTTVHDTTAYLVYSIVATVITLLILLVIVVMRKRIGLVIRLFAEAQKALADMPMLFVTPFLTFIVLIMFLAYWMLTAFLIYSFDNEYQSTASLTVLSFKVDRHSLSIAMWVYQAIALIWVSEFIFACQSMIVCSAVAKWYFTKPKSNLRMPICTALNRLIVYHMGSVALGSFLITLIRIPRYCLMYLQEKIKTPGSSLGEFCSKACICCLWFLEKFMLFVNYNAYTVIAIEGVSFCAAAQKAFSLIVENALRVATINSVGDFMLFLAKVAVTVLTLILAVFWLQVPIDNLDRIKSDILPLLLVAVIAFLIAHCFFTIYEMVIDALMVCFCEDCRANDGTEDRPYYMSNSLKKFVDETSSTHITVNN